MGNKYFNNDEREAGIDGIRNLSIEDLESISGGRDIRKTESDEWRAIADNFEREVCRLQLAGKTAEAGKLARSYASALRKWTKAIDASPASGPDIHFSDYFQM